MLTKKEFADCTYNVLTPHDPREMMNTVPATAKNPDRITRYENGHFLIGHKNTGTALPCQPAGSGSWRLPGSVPPVKSHTG